MSESAFRKRKGEEKNDGQVLGLVDNKKKQ